MPPVQTQLEGTYAGSGDCYWAPERREGVGAIFLAQIATRAVSSFASMLSRDAGRSEANAVANFTLRGNARCVQFIRGSLDLSMGPATENPSADNVARVAAMLSRSGVGAEDHSALARTLLRNGLPLAGTPSLIIEARLLRVERMIEVGGQTSSTPTEYVVLDPTFIYYRDPLVSQPLRFWANDARSFAMQIQVAAAPASPGAQAAGSSAAVGRFERGDSRRLIPDSWSRAPTPRAVFGFSLETNRAYNARLSVTESTSESAFLKFWAEVVGAQPVQQALSGELNYALIPDARDRAEADAYAAARVALVTSVNACPAASVAETERVTWIRTNRVVLSRAYATYADAARYAGYRGMPPEFPSTADATGPTIPNWCEEVRTYLNTH